MVFWILRRLQEQAFCRLGCNVVRATSNENVLIVANDLAVSKPRGRHRTFLSRSASLFALADRILRVKGLVKTRAFKGLFCVVIIVSPALAEEYRFRADGVLGSSYELTVLSSDEVVARSAHEAALSEITRLENILSTWKTDSEISRLNNASDFTASKELFDFLTTCEMWRKETENALSCRIGKLLDAWRNAQEKGVIPDQDFLSALAKKINEVSLPFDPATRRIYRPDNVIFAVDSMAKGWILDRAADRALDAAPGVVGVILNIGGDLKIAGNVSDKAPRIGIAGPGSGDNEAPMEIISVSEGSVASSGAGKRDMDVAGRAYSHILAPETGQPQSITFLTSVVAPTAAEADALATAFAVMGVGKSLAFANAREGVEVVIVTSGGARFASDGWSSFITPIVKVSADAAGIENPWLEKYRLDIEYEVPAVDAVNYEAPYVAIWVTTPEKELVRSLMLLGDVPRWVEENYRFWRRYGRKQPALVDTLAQPTRMPGRYQLVWDGRNDAGEPVPQGTFILHIEASREHGGHSYVSKELALLGAPMEAIMPAQGEIGEIILHYGADD